MRTFTAMATATASKLEHAREPAHMTRRGQNVSR
jgi:hypothetical protein